jgi:hypothetical protein
MHSTPSGVSVSGSAKESAINHEIHEVCIARNEEA